MICKHCSFDNKDGAAFCANCGKPLGTAPVAPTPAPAPTAPVAPTAPAAPVAPTPAPAPTAPVAPAPAPAASAMTPISNSGETKTVVLDPMKEEKPDAPIEDKDGEANTTVLTSSMTGKLASNAQAGATPAGFANGPKPNGAPAPMGAPMGAPTPMGQNGPKPMGAPTPMGQNGPKPMGAPTGQMTLNNPAPAKNDKPAKASKGGSGTGTKVYIIVSAILLVALIGVGVWGYITMNGKIDDANNEKTKVASELDATKNEVNELNGKVASLEASEATNEQTISDLNVQIEGYTSQIADYETQLSDLESSSNANAGLVDFANSSYGQAYSDFFVSDTVIHLTEETTLKIYFDGTAEQTILYQCTDGNVCGITDGGWDNEKVGNLILTPGNSGTAILTLGNEANDETITVYIFVD